MIIIDTKILVRRLQEKIDRLSHEKHTLEQRISILEGIVSLYRKESNQVEE